MVSNPLISVIIPSYNHAHFIQEALNSVIKQTYKHWECIIVDDGSTDNLKDVLTPYLEKYKNIYYLYQDNKGLSVSRNMGFLHAKGEYIQFLDADDKIQKMKFEDQIRILESDKTIDVCFSNYQQFDSETGILLGRYASVVLSENPLQDFLYKWERELSIPIHCAIFKKNIFGITAPFVPELAAKEDWVMWVQLALKNAKFKFLDKDYAYYRVHSSNMTKDNYKMMKNMIIAVSYLSSLLPEEMKKHFEIESDLLLRSNYIANLQEFIVFKPALYIDQGDGFTGDHYIKCINRNENKNRFSVTFKLADFYYLKSLRFDPLEGHCCKLIIDQISLIQENNEKIIAWDELKKIILCNGEINDRGEIFFYTTDPQVVLPFEGKIDFLKIEGKLCIIGFDQLIQYKDQLIQYKDQLIQYKDSVIALIKSSYAIKIGKMITWMPRKLRNLFKD